MKCFFYFGMTFNWPTLGDVSRSYLFLQIGARNLSKKVWPWKVTQSRPNESHTKIKKKYLKNELGPLLICPTITTRNVDLLNFLFGKPSEGFLAEEWYSPPWYMGGGMLCQTRRSLWDHWYFRWWVVSWVMIQENRIRLEPTYSGELYKHRMKFFSS